MKNGDIVLRYIKEDDIANYIRWTTVETEWTEWDAPWEDDDGNDFVERQRAALKETPNVFTKLEIDTNSGQHIGWVSSYCIDRDKNKTAVGIDIPPIDFRGKGYGERALSLFMSYLFSSCNKEILFAQTWSGNTSMIRLAEKIGFAEIERIINYREVKGKKYDALTFSMTKETFFKKYIKFRSA
ncbi:MAG: GNAT family N-acetyltransferase [Oscillospiraceae bacterium]|nr:GNAT family N-acetyltransferase [Oscillospiraceae bacterium]